MPTQWIKTSEDFFKKIYHSLNCKIYVCERELKSEQNCNILTPTLLAISVVSFSFSWCSTGGPGLSFLLSAGFLYHTLSPTGLDSIGGLKGSFCRVAAFLPHLLSNSSDLQLTDFLSLPSYIIVQSPTQSPTQSLEWHVWSSSSGNNCHAFQRSLFRWICLWVYHGLLPCLISLAKSAYAISFDYWPLECVTSCRCITLEWHVWPGRRSIYNTCSVCGPPVFSEVQYEKHCFKPYKCEQIVCIKDRYLML